MVLFPMDFLPGTLPDLWWIRHAPQVIAAIREGNQTAKIKETFWLKLTNMWLSMSIR